MHFNGIGTEEDIEEAMRCFERAGENKHKKSLEYLAKMYKEGIGVRANKEKAIKYFEKIAENIEKEKGEAYFNIALIFSENFLNSPNDFKSAIEFYEKSALFGNKDALFNAGLLYYQQKDIPNAILFFKKSAFESNNADAYFNLAVIFKDHPKKSLFLLKKAAQLGNIEAQQILVTKSFQFDENTPKN